MCSCQTALPNAADIIFVNHICYAHKKSHYFQFSWKCENIHFPFSYLRVQNTRWCEEHVKCSVTKDVSFFSNESQSLSEEKPINWIWQVFDVQFNRRLPRLPTNAPNDRSLIYIIFLYVLKFALQLLACCYTVCACCKPKKF